jgi:hypothetical protein
MVIKYDLDKSRPYDIKIPMFRMLFYNSYIFFSLNLNLSKRRTTRKVTNLVIPSSDLNSNHKR